MRNRKAAFPILFVGLIGFMNVARNPRFDAFHTVDILQLAATGVCLGLFLSAFLPARHEK